MRINKTRELTFDTDETILTATISKPNEIVMMMSSGSVVRFNLAERTGAYLFSIKREPGYADGGFDIGAKSSIYTLDEIVVVANDYRRDAIIHYPSKYRLHLRRDDYHTEISTYPVALYKNQEGVPHIIFAEAWNHIQIMNLDTRQILTASKSLIEENAEERHIELYKIYKEENKLAWPRPYDYFFGKLFLSPDQKKFLSAGWVWGSFDCYTVYDIGKFISSNRISALRIGGWEHESRATCWVDNETIAILYNPFAECDENATADSPYEIHIYKINGDQIVPEKKIEVRQKISINSKMHYSTATHSLIIFSEKHGLSILSLDGELLFKDEHFIANEYHEESGLFIHINNKTISAFELVV